MHCVERLLKVNQATHQCSILSRPFCALLQERCCAEKIVFCAKALSVCSLVGRLLANDSLPQSATQHAAEQLVENRQKRKGPVIARQLWISLFEYYDQP